MWQCLSTIMMKKIGNLQISFMSSALVKKDVYYNRAKKKKRVGFGGQPNMERFCGKQVAILWNLLASFQWLWAFSA